MHSSVLVVLACMVALTVAQDCSSAPNCAACVAIPLCGWCSVPVTYNNNQTGPQCAGFGPGSKPFVCNAVYSTEVCQRGYICDPTDSTCELTNPGQGTTLAQCEAACHSNTTHVYLCNTTTKQCYIVPDGTPGSSSLEICEATCQHKKTPSPGPVQQTYLCNQSTWQCYATTPGHGASLLVCQEQCNANNTQYICNYQNGQCVEVPPLTPNSVPLATCQQECNGVTPAPIPPNPGPPPEYIGIWRGVEIQNDYKIVEWDILINNSIAIFTVISQTAMNTFSGTPYHIPNSPKLEMWVEISTGMYAGLTVRTIGDTSGERGPETEFATMAMAAPGAPAPASITSAMTDGNSTVMALAKCLVDEDYCNFVMPSSVHSGKRMKAAFSKIDKVVNAYKAGLKAGHTGPKKQQQQVVASNVASGSKKSIKGKFTDQCSGFDESCSVCLSHANCGWCSVPVTYSDGEKGTQCAGFEGTNSTPFVCPGHYSTESCEIGYICTSSLTCVATVPGDGMPHDVCLQVCKATPPPAPEPPQYTCNLTTKQCDSCPSGACPGSMPQQQCESLCPHPQPGPTPDLIGVWRGIYIQQRYSVGEVDFVFNNSGCTVYKDGVFFFFASIISLGSDVMLFTIQQGDGAGHSFGTLYQLASEDFGMYFQMTMAIGKMDQSFPTDYNTPMYTTGMQEVVLAQCLKAPCQFHAP